MTGTGSRPVVIGIDGSEGSRQALVWGLGLAQRRDAPVLLLRAVDPSLSHVIGGDYSPAGRPDLLAAGQELLEKEQVTAQEGCPGLKITTLLVEEPAATALVHESKGAEAVVVGSHGVSAFSTLLAGSTTMNVATHAHCPVVALPSTPPDVGATGIVVGVDGTGLSDHAVDWAFREAADTGESLTAVLAWMDPVVPGVIAAAFPVHDDPVDALRRPHEILRAWLEPLTGTYPDVLVHRRVVREHPVHALTSTAATARLLVVGCRGRGPARSMMLGSVSHGVLHLAACPVAVIPHHD